MAGGKRRGRGCLSERYCRLRRSAGVIVHRVHAIALCEQEISVPDPEYCP